MKKLIFKNAFLFYIGMTTYISVEVFYRNYSYAIMGICGGLAIVILDKINNYISWDVDFLLQGCIGSILITGMELIIGLCSLNGVLPVMWDYSNVWLNYKGIICLPFSLIWVILSMVAIVCADMINYYIFNEPTVPYYKLFGKTIIKFKEKR
jgi:uncharacterized membrane protein